MTQFSLSADITKVDKKKHIVEGYATTSDPDRDQQIIDEDFLKNNYKDWATKYGNIRYMHQPKVVGHVLTCSDWQNNGFYITAKISDPDTWQQIEDGELNGFSIGIKNPTVIPDPVAPGGRLVDGEIIETSVVDIPAAYRADFVAIKAATFDDNTNSWKVNKTADANDAIVAPLNDGDIDWINAMLDGFGVDDDDTAQFAKRYYSAKDRKAMPNSEFGDPAHKAFPVHDQQDLDNAAHLIGHARNPEQVKQRLIEIAHRKGLKIPDAWQSDKVDKTLDTSSGLQPYNLEGDKEEKSTVADENKTMTPDEMKAAFEAAASSVMENMMTQLTEIRAQIEGMANQVDKDRDGDVDNFKRPEAWSAEKLMDEPGQEVETAATTAPNDVEETEQNGLGLKTVNVDAIVEQVTKTVMAAIDERFNTITKSTVADNDGVKGLIAGLQKSATELAERLEVVEQSAQPAKGVAMVVEKTTSADSDGIDGATQIAEIYKTVRANNSNLSPILLQQKIDAEIAKIKGGHN